MPIWRARLEIADLWKARRNDEISLAELCRGIVDRGRALPVPIPARLFAPLEALANDPEGDDVDTFDAAWSRIYDWADMARVWIKIF